MQKKRVFIVGDSQIIAYVVYDESGKIKEEESEYATLTSSKKNNKSLIIDLRNNTYLDSIHVNVIEGFDFQYNHKAKVLRSASYSGTNRLQFEVSDADYVRGKLNLMIVSEEYKTEKEILENYYFVQLTMGKPLPKNNVHPIYKDY